MITLKKIDAYGQLLLISLAILLSVCLQGETIFYSYFIVGGWQVGSTLVQLCFNKRWPELKERRGYQLFLLFSAITAPAGSFMLLLFIAPVTAIWYLFISFRELRIWQHRQFIQLR